MMETELTQVDAGAGDGKVLSKQHDSGVTSIKHELENESQTSNSKHLFAVSGLDVTIKDEDYSDNVSSLLENIVKSELVEFQSNASTEISNSNQNDDVKTVTLEKIPKTEIKMTCGEPHSSPDKKPDLGNNNTDSDSDSTSGHDPELDPFGEIDCDPSFSQKQPQSSNNSNNHPATSLPLRSVASKKKSAASSQKPGSKNPNKGGRFKCQKYLINFANQRDLTYHDMEVHVSKRQFKCDIPNCKEAFSFRYLLTDHLREVHLEDKPFKCSTPKCAQKFKSPGQLQSHILTHSWGIGRPACPLACCNGKLKSKRRVTQPQPLDVHTASVARRPKRKNNRRFECPEPNCTSIFKYGRSLEMHLATFHPPNPDEILKRENYIKDNFRYNTRSHKCSEPGCLATFSRLDVLKSHIKYDHNKTKAAVAVKKGRND